MRKRNAQELDLTFKGRDGSFTVFKLCLPQGTEHDDLDFAKILRDAIAKSGLSQYHLAKAADVPQGAISVFLAGGDLRLSTFNKLAYVMGFSFYQNNEAAPEKIDRRVDRPKRKKRQHRLSK